MRSFKTKCEVLYLVQNFKILIGIYLINKFWLPLRTIGRQSTDQGKSWQLAVGSWRHSLKQAVCNKQQTDRGRWSGDRGQLNKNLGITTYG
jgi:hypothetical protein